MSESRNPYESYDPQKDPFVRDQPHIGPGFGKKLSEETPTDILNQVALSTAPLPGIGDVVGLMADINMLFDEATATNVGMTLLGALPFVPAMSVLRSGSQMPQIRRSEVFGEKYQVRESNVVLNDIKLRENPFTGSPQGTDPNTVAQIQAARGAGDVIPEITVRQLDDGSYELIDGHHRLAAMQASGIEKSDVFVIRDEPSKLDKAIELVDKY